MVKSQSALYFERFKFALAKIFWLIKALWHHPFYLSYVIVLTTFLYYEYLKEIDMNEILSSQVHEHIFGDDENNNLNGPRRLLAENLDYQQMELTTEDREDHTFNGKRSCCLFFTSRRETQIG